MRSIRIPPSAEMAEKTFGRKRTADSQLTPKAFVAKRVVAPAKATVRRFGRVIARPLKWMGGQIEKEMKINKAKDDGYRAVGPKLNKQFSAPALGRVKRSRMQ